MNLVLLKNISLVGLHWGAYLSQSILSAYESDNELIGLPHS